MDRMDTKTEQAQIETIKARMVNVHAALKVLATERGNGVYALVRRGLRGEANCFYAFEKGWVVGTPFSLGSVSAELAANMVNFGVDHVWLLGADLPDAARKVK